MKNLWIAAVVAVVLTASCSTESPPSDEQVAAQTCRQEIQKQAKDPGSVQFPDEDFKVGKRSDTTMNGKPSYEWEVTGQVNAKNSFGAYEGFQDFTCQAFKTPPDEWVSSVKFAKS